MSTNLGLGFSEFNLRMDKPPVQKIYEFEDFRFDARNDPTKLKGVDSF